MEKTREIFLVGGAVRDLQLGLSPSDMDYVAVGYEEKDFKNLEKTGKDFPVFRDNESKFVKIPGSEIALARREKSTGNGYGSFTVDVNDVTLEEDLSRRDLTINAMAYRMKENGERELIDPLNGMKDLEDKVLRHCSEAFAEDPIRVLRVARFKARLKPLGFKIAPKTKALAYSMRESLKTLCPERVWKEVEKVLKFNNSDEFFYALLEMNVLDVVFPNIYEMLLCREGSKYHQESSVFEHSMMVLRELSRESLDLKLAAIYHDIAKPYTYKMYGNGGGHDNIELIEPLIDIQIPKKLREKVIFLVDNHIRIFEFEKMRASKIVNLFMSSGRTQEMIYKLLKFAKADLSGRLTVAKKRDISNYEDLILGMHAQVTCYSPKEWIEENTFLIPPTNQQIRGHIESERIRIVKDFRKGIKW